MKKNGVFYAVGYDASPSFMMPEKGFMLLDHNPFRIVSMEDMTVTFNSCSFDEPDGSYFKITWELVRKEEK